MKPSMDPRILDQTTENYSTLWLETRSEATEATNALTNQIAELAAAGFPELASGISRFGVMTVRGGGIGLVSLQGERAFRLFNGYILETEARLRQLLAKHTAEIWLLLMRRDLAAKLVHAPAMHHEAVRRMVLEQKMSAAIALWAAQGSSVLP